MHTHETFSHPDAAVRHSYPLATHDASLTTALGLMRRTLPYALARFGILVASSLATLLWVVATFGGYLWIAHSPVPLLAYAWFLVMSVAGAGLWFVVGRYFLYLVKAGHIAVLTELLTTGAIAQGSESMFEHGRRVVLSRFGEVSLLFGLDVLVDGVVRTFNRTLDWVAELLPIPGLSTATGAVGAVVHASTTYIDETVFSYNLARNDDNVWRSSRDGLVYYAQNAREVLKTGLWIVVLDKVLSVLAWLLCLVPAAAVAWLLPDSLSGWGLLPIGLSFLFAWNVRAALLKPLFLTVVMIRFHHLVQDQPIRAEWAERLESVSDRFHELGQRAHGFTAPGGLTPGSATTST